jgi:CheY-like chemotaxis protein
MMAQILEGAGYQVVVADCVQAALAHADDPLDLVLSDIGLPDGTGLDLMRALRARRPLPGIALSGYGTTEDVNRSLAAGFHRHMVKPVEIPELLRAIQDCPRLPPSPPLPAPNVFSRPGPVPPRPTPSDDAR